MITLGELAQRFDHTSSIGSYTRTASRSPARLEPGQYDSDRKSVVKEKRIDIDGRYIITKRSAIQVLLILLPPGCSFFVPEDPRPGSFRS